MIGDLHCHSKLSDGSTSLISFFMPNGQDWTFLP